MKRIDTIMVQLFTDENIRLAWVLTQDPMLKTLFFHDMRRRKILSPNEIELFYYENGQFYTNQACINLEQRTNFDTLLISYQNESGPLMQKYWLAQMDNFLTSVADALKG